MEAALLLAKLPEAYSVFDPLVDVLPVIPVFTDGRIFISNILFQITDFIYYHKK